jgi:hypothetical protein
MMPDADDVKKRGKAKIGDIQDHTLILQSIKSAPG